MKLTEDTFELIAAKSYDNPSCCDIEEFHDDLARFRYVKRLFTKYQQSGEIKERLVLNHMIVLYNLFGSECTRMLFFKLEGQWQFLKPFLVYLNRLPDKMFGVGKHDVLDTIEIPMDPTIVNLLRRI
jgi:hypothetical protein